MFYLMMFVVAVLAVGGTFLILLGNSREQKNRFNAQQRGELVRLRILKNKLRVQAMDHLISDPFASIVLDEIAKHERELEGK